MFILIGAMGLNREIGNNGKLPWHLPEDLKYFKCMTNNHKIVMGRTTYESFEKPLEDRHHIVITSSNISEGKDIECFSSIEDFLNKYEKSSDDIYIIGGSSIYKQFIPICDILLITEIQSSFDADAFMPEIDYDEFELYNNSAMFTSFESGLKYRFLTYIRKTMDTTLMV